MTHNTITSSDLALLFIIHVFSKHSVLAHVTCNWGSEFISHFFQSLSTALDMKLHFTLGYHPEGDGQTEHTNQTLEQYIRVYCNYQQDNWFGLLPLAEFASNNALGVTTTVTPFYTNKGYHPNLTIHPEQELASSRAKEFITDLNELHQHLREHMAAAQLWYQGTADTSQTLAPEFLIGSWAYVKAQFYHTTCPYKKLADTFLGPYEVIAQLGTHSVTLHLPDSLCAVHPVFHVSMLEPATLNVIPDRVQPPPPPIFVDGEPEFDIAEVLDSKIDHWRSKCEPLYLVCWTRYAGTDEETSWILASELGNAPELVSDFHQSYPAKLGSLEHL